MAKYTDPIRAFYRGKRVLVTGHTGLKGSWLALWLTQLGAKVHGIALPPDSPLSNFASSKLEGVVEHEIQDIRDLAGLKAAVARAQPEIVFHLAAQALVGPSYEMPVETFHTNVMGSIHVLESVRGAPSVRVVVMITSDKCYENVEQIWGYRETDRLGGDDPYSASKAATEIAIKAYVKSFFGKDGAPAVATVRAGNVIGGGDWSKFRLVPDCVRSLRSGETIRIRNPRATRPWQYVLEPLGGYLTLGAKLAASRSFMGSWNFGPAVDNTNTVEKGTQEMIRHWGSGAMEIVPNVFHENTALQLDCTKALHHLGWHTCLGFQDTMKWTCAWYKHQAETKDGAMRDFGLSQIEAYERLMDEGLSPT